MRLSHAELIKHERLFPTGHREGYAGFKNELTSLRDRFYAEFLGNKKPKQPEVNEILAAFDSLPPEEFSSAYELSDDDIQKLATMIQRKYMLRFKNIRRSWALLIQHMPELMSSDAPTRDVLEMSSAHGATLEILRHFGHRPIGNDFPNFLTDKSEVNSRLRRINGVDLTQITDDHGTLAGDGTVDSWLYQPIIESLGLDVRLFDAGQTPYPFESGSFDTVMCFDAIEHYCHPLDWMVVVDEFVRLSRRSVLLITNPVQGNKLDDNPYMNAFYQFQKDMVSYSNAGFECIHAGISRNQLTAYKLAKLSSG